MLRLSLPLALALILLPVATASAATREGAALFTPPAGWSRVADGGNTRYVSPDKTAWFSVGRSQSYEGTLEKPLDGVLEKAKALPQYRQESRQPGGWHRSTDGQWVSAVYSYADAGSNAFHYSWVALIGADGRYAPFTATFTSANAYKTHGLAFADALNTVTLTSSKILEPGKPPLTRFAIDESLDFLEWLLQTPLTSEQKATVEMEVRGYWKAKNTHEMEGIIELLAARDQLAALGAAQRDLAREAIAEGAIAEWRADRTSPSAKMILEIYDAAHKPIAAGPPPLTRQAVDAFAEFLFFAAAQTADTTAAPAPELKAKLAQEAAAGYAAMDPAQRELIAGMPLLWAALQVAWPDLPADQKRAIVDGWKQSASMVQLGAVLKASAAPAVAEAATPAAAGAGEKTVGRSAGAAPGNAAARAASDQAQVARDMYRNQMQLQMQQRQFQMMQTMLQQTHDTQRIMMSNLGGNTSYQYQWR
jgi:hypothetical protein